MAERCNMPSSWTSTTLRNTVTKERPLISRPVFTASRLAHCGHRSFARIIFRGMNWGSASFYRTLFDGARHEAETVHDRKKLAAHWLERHDWFSSQLTIYAQDELIANCDPFDLIDTQPVEAPSASMAGFSKISPPIRSKFLIAGSVAFAPDGSDK
jgi:hypothetical protein